MPSQAIGLAWVAEAIRPAAACPALPHREAQEGKGRSLTLVYKELAN